MRKNTFASAALACTASLLMAFSSTAGAESIRQGTTQGTTTQVRTATLASSRLAGDLIATKRDVPVRGVGQPGLKPNVCNVNPERFKGCAVYQ